MWARKEINKSPPEFSCPHKKPTRESWKICCHVAKIALCSDAEVAQGEESTSLLYYIRYTRVKPALWTGKQMKTI